MNSNPVLEAIAARRAIRRYADRPVSRAQIEAVLRAANRAPSAHNRQPWRFAVLTRRADRERLARAMGDRLRADRLADGDPPAAVERDVARSFARIAGAPVVLVVCLSMAGMDAYPDERRARAEWVMAVQSVSMAAQNMWLAAHSLGLGMCWLCAPLFAPEAVRRTLALPADWEPLGLMTLGHPAETPRRKPRAPLSERVIWV